MTKESSTYYIDIPSHECFGKINTSVEHKMKVVSLTARDTKCTGKYRTSYKGWVIPLFAMSFLEYLLLSNMSVCTSIFFVNMFFSNRNRKKGIISMYINKLHYTS